ncbi:MULTISPECIES: lipid A deacylase LpxR family protein [unclassified Iodidimonas]|jgi:hypothetical protein|uniref:lipid A deacylase LpxR family protein n=1 Tax=unclassified Iodidimonas TaxID=2626145 RepID=UPI002482BF15|nr:MULTISPECIES: lipid A deacylase LpxR family protein [unclassified Iodidimonas]
MTYPSGFFLFLIGLTLPISAALAQSMPPSKSPQRSVLSFQSENDLYGDGKDRWFTNGFRLALALAPDDRPGAVSFIGDWLPSKPAASETDLFMAIGQSMFSPEDITIRERQPDDRPYAGWLFVEVGASGQVGNMQETLTLSLGVTGSPSLAERTQKFVHTLTNSPEPQGWDYQIKAEPTVQLYYERAWFYQIFEWGDWLAGDLSPRIGADLGTVFVDANLGLVGRIGNFLPHALPPRINPSATGSGKILRAKPNGIGWSLFAGYETRAVARNLFLDGGIFDQSQSVAKKTFVREFSAGLVLSFDRFALTYSYIERSREFELQRTSQVFGSVNLSIAF